MLDEMAKHISIILSLYFYEVICNYCLKVVDKDNFIDVLEERMKDDE